MENASTGLPSELPVYYSQAWGSLHNYFGGYIHIYSADALLHVSGRITTMNEYREVLNDEIRA